MKKSFFERVVNLDCLMLGYLALPNFCFLLGWLKPVYALPTASLFLLAFSFLCRKHTLIETKVGISKTTVLIAMSFALPWIVLSGMGHFVYANADWVVRDAVLLDLVRSEWPVRYLGNDVTEIILLRAPIGFYLPAALAGKLAGVRWADLGLAIWALVGVMLTLLLMLRNVIEPKVMAGRILVFIFFSGMDVIGAMLYGLPITWGVHLEWWAGVFQYSSQTTQLFWVPNHAIPGWIAIAWLVTQKRGELSIPFAITIVACVPLWSPLTAIGLFPFFTMAILREMRIQDLGQQILAYIKNGWLLAIVVILVGFVFPYLLINEASVKSEWIVKDASSMSAFLVRYSQFVVLEFLILALLLFRNFGKDPLLIMASIVLLALPFYSFGPYNDLTMRASIPALAVIAIRLGEWFTSPASDNEVTEYARSLAILLVIIGAATSLLEISRSFIQLRTEMNTSASVIDATNGNAPHYLAIPTRGWATEFLR